MFDSKAYSFTVSHRRNNCEWNFTISDDNVIYWDSAVNYAKMEFLIGLTGEDFVLVASDSTAGRSVVVMNEGDYPKLLEYTSLSIRC